MAHGARPLSLRLAGYGVSGVLALSAAAGGAGGAGGSGAAGAAGQAAGNGRFTALAYTGAPISRWWGSFIIELSGIECPGGGGTKPLLLEHGCTDEWPNVGFIDTFSLSEQGLSIAGGFLGNDTAKKVRADALDGFPWEASIHVDPREVSMLADGVKATVNGREVTGPMLVISRSLMRETSVCVLGADPDTQTDMTAMRLSGRDDSGMAPGMIPGVPGVPGGGLLGGTSMSKNNGLDLTGLTIDSLKLARPDLVEQISLAAAAGGAVPATIEQIEAIPGATPELVLTLAKAKATEATALKAVNAALKLRVDNADSERAKLMSDHKAVVDSMSAEREKLRTDLALAAKAAGVNPLSLGLADPKAAQATGGDKSPGGLGLSGTDPEADWKASEALRLHWKDNKRAFMRYAGMELRDGGNYLACLDKQAA